MKYLFAVCLALGLLGLGIEAGMASHLKTENTVQRFNRDVSDAGTDPVDANTFAFEQ